MANTYFQFKQFTVHQEHTAMKVCTDACLFGAWVAKDEAIDTANSILDIGTGTGLLSLILAQATAHSISPAQITAIEIEASAATEAASNFALSPWKDRLIVKHSSIQAYSDTDNITVSEFVNNKNVIKQFDCIITNPPFFEGDLQSPDANKNLASHSTALPWSALINEVNGLLKTDGCYYVIIPALRAYTMQKLATQNGIQLVEEVIVFNAAKQKPFRVFQKYIKAAKPIKDIKRSNFIIKDDENKYTENFVDLLKDYYLHL
jgi:tRNA1Val (adenine37-N6)-methyltransferase